MGNHPSPADKDGFNVFCYAHGSGSDWEALCLDFNLAVQGDSLEDVKATLTEAVRSYVEDALHEDEATRRQLLNRKAPLHVRLGVAAHLAFYALKKRRRPIEVQASFPLPCHA